MKRSNDDTSVPEKKVKTNQAKILVVGDIKGNFSECFTKLNQINEKNGPFDLCFCVGRFFSDSPEYNGADSLESQKFLSGQSKISIPTYFVDCSQNDKIENSHGQSFQICHNLTFLGKFGVIELKEFSIGFLSGLFDKYTYFSSSVSSPIVYNQHEIKEFEAILAKSSIDVFLSCEWSNTILNNLAPDQMPKVRPEQSSPIISKIIKSINPKYHFAGTENVYFERVPYVHQNNGNVCRFIALGDYGSSEKHLYAFTLTSSFPSEVKAISQSPYEETERRERVVTHAKKYTPRKNIQQVSDIKCWFCLSNPELEKHLLVSIGDESYLAFPKGGVTDDHLLLISMNHCTAYVDLSDDAVKEFDVTIEALKKYFAKENKSLVIFERNIRLDKVPLHMHFQIVPIPNSELKNAENIFQEELTLMNAKYTVYDEKVPLKDVITDSNCVEKNYFLVILPDGKKVIHQIQKSKEMINFGRRVCARLLSCPEKDDWKKCALSKVEETKHVLEFRSKFKK